MSQNQIESRPYYCDRITLISGIPYKSTMSEITRLVSQYAFRPDWSAKKMVFIAGPRQVGKLPKDLKTL